MTKSAPSWQVDPTIHADRSVDHYANNRRKRQRQLGRNMARKRLVDNVLTANSSAKHKHNGILKHHSRSVYLAEGGYCNCSFLDGQDLLLAVSIHGEIEVFRMPPYNEVGTGETTMTPLALKVRFNENPSSSDYSVYTRFKLKPLQTGQAFAVGSPSGSFSIFATEHLSTWCTPHYNVLPKQWKKTVRQQPLMRDDHAMGGRQSSTPWAPFITQQWQSDMEVHKDISRGMLPVFSTQIRQQDFSLSTRPDALWDFQECSSGLLAAHHLDGVVRLLDSRTVGNSLNNVSSIGKAQRGDYNSIVADKQVTALCFASALTLLTADALRRQNGKIDNTIHTWDLRKTASPINAFTPTYVEDGHVSLLTPSTDTAGKVMVTCSRPPSDLQHFWFDLGRHRPITGDSLEMIPASVHSKNVNMLCSPFAVNSNQDFMACYERSTKTMNLFDLESVNRQVSRKRGLHDEHRPNATADNQGFECVASFQPTVMDRYGLTSELACMAMNDLGTAIVGGSNDGDLYAWRGS